MTATRNKVDLPFGDPRSKRIWYFRAIDIIRLWSLLLIPYTALHIFVTVFVARHRSMLEKDSIIVLNAVRHTFPGEKRDDEVEFILYNRIYRYTKFYCIQDGQPIEARIRNMLRTVNPFCKWTPAHAVCQVKPKLEVTVSPDGRFDSPFNGDISYLLRTSERLKPNYRMKFIVCFSLLYNYSYWPILVQTLEMWIALGAELLVMHVETTNRATLEVIRHYEEAGIVQIKYWPSLPWIGRQFTSYDNGRVLGILCRNYCIQLLRYSTEFIVTTSFDSVMIPANTLEPLIDRLRGIAKRYPDTGAYLFQEAIAVMPQPCFKNLTAKKLFKPIHNMKVEQCINGGICGKQRRTIPVVDPTRVDQVQIHDKTIMRENFVETYIPCEEAYFLHFRLEKYPRCKPKKLKYLKPVLEKATNSLDVSPFVDLPCDVSETYPIHACYETLERSLVLANASLCWFEMDICPKRHVTPNCSTYASSFKEYLSTTPMYVLNSPTIEINKSLHCSLVASVFKKEKRQIGASPITLDMEY